MKKIFIVIVLLTVISNYSMATTEDNLHWFKDAKFGLFIHWGLPLLSGCPGAPSTFRFDCHGGFAYHVIIYTVQPAIPSAGESVTSPSPRHSVS